MMEPKEANRRVFEQQATIDSWDRDYYHTIAEDLYDQAISKMLRLMEVERGAVVLDAGCGPGVHSVRVARAGSRVCAVDISDTMLQEAEVRISEAGLISAVELRHEDLTALSFRDASFRYVFSWGVIIHIREVEKALDELARVVEPGGKLALYVTNRNSLDQKLETVVRFLIRRPLVEKRSLRLGNGTWYEMHGQRLWVWQFDIPELVRQLELRGLQLTHRQIGEFSEIQRRVGGSLKRLLLKLNNLCYRLNLSPSLGVGNLLVFRKTSEQLQL
jgi:ubiquinone/menaquinone biosynthesis C-methylase UbiE